jgi:hypothetical protein
MLKNISLPEAATSGSKLAAEITDKAGYAQRWQFSRRTVDNLLRDGLPHIKYGKRRVRIVIREGDRWMVQRYGQQRRGPAPSFRPRASK